MYAADKLAGLVRYALNKLESFNWKSLIPDIRIFLPRPPPLPPWPR
jgi:hypothetical protein